MEFINEGDLEELFRRLDDGDVHYAAEVSGSKFPHRSKISSTIYV